MVFTDNISIFYFTPFLAFVIQTAYIPLHISEMLAYMGKWSVLNISLLAKYDHMVTIYQPQSLVPVTYLFLHSVYE